jgi:hypothetical protein
MKSFFEEYVAIPLCVLLLFFLAPTVMLGGLKLAATLVDMTPACEVRK